MTKQIHPKRAGWVHHPRLDVVGPLDQSLQLPLAAGGPPLTLHHIYTDDGVYVPALSLQPGGRAPFATVICIHGGSGGLGTSYLVDHVMQQGWVIEELLGRGYAVVFAEGRCEIEDAYDSGYAGVLDHNDMVAVFRAVCRQPWVDPGRVGFFGVSHGGELQMKVVAEIGKEPGAPMPAALVMCEPAVIEFLGLKYEGERREANLQFHEPIGDGQIDLERAMLRIARIPDTLPMLVVGRDEDHLQGPFMKLHELLRRAGKRAEWLSFSHPEHAYQFGPRRDADGYLPDDAQATTLAHAIGFLERHLRTAKS